MNPIHSKEDKESYRDSVATVGEDGKRVWIYPKKPKGRFYNWRGYLSYILLGFLFVTPWIKVNGLPVLLFNVIERRFIIFGLHFTPQDFHLFVLAMLIMVVAIALFTVIFGRLFCGWVCPQTIFMEMVYRKIEYWIEGDASAQKRLAKAPWTNEKIFKKVSKQIIFFAIAVLVANTFLAYIIGSDQLMQILIEPISLHWKGFSSMILFSFVFYFVFSVLREQVCVTICPYGRLQSVLLDQDSIVIHYDHVRGEPRGKIKKQKPIPLTSINGNSQSFATLVTPALGDCIDCSLCVQVCPTGIDIRNGTQLECVNCTACIDACDEVMDKVGRDRGLIRYDSYQGVTSERKSIFTTRVIMYSVALIALMALEIGLFVGQSSVEVLFLRTPGVLYQEINEGEISNLYNYQIHNKSTDDLELEFRFEDGQEGSLRWVGDSPVVDKNATAEGIVFIDISTDKIKDRKTKIEIGIYSNDLQISTVKTTFIGPMN